MNIRNCFFSESRLTSDMTSQSEVVQQKIYDIGKTIEFPEGLCMISVMDPGGQNTDLMVAFAFLL